MKGDVTAAIARLEKTLIWRRTENVEDLQAMSDSCEPEVSCLRPSYLVFVDKGALISSLP